MNSLMELVGLAQEGKRDHVADTRGKKNCASEQQLTLGWIKHVARLLF